MELVKLNRVYKSFLADKRPSLRTLFSKNQKRTLVLKDISFKVEAGALLGIIGKNGVGKSTLLRLIGGIYEKDSGEVITRGDIASIFELGSFFNSYLTGKQYCRDYFRFKGINGSKLNALCDSIYEFTQLEDFFCEPVRSYSSGMQARLLFAVATALPAKIILIDEFLVVGDEYFRGKAWKRLQQFLSMGATGIIVSHDWVSLLKLCQQCLVLTREGIDYFGPSYKAVRRYLNMPFQRSDEITFVNIDKMLKEMVYAVSGEPFNYNFQAQSLEKFKDNAISVGFCIERHIEGIGWSLITIGLSNININPDTKINITISIEDFCLAPGEYLLCLFLSAPLEKGQRSITKGYESLTWLNGNPIRLVVKGENKSNQLITKKLQWKIV
ncbi:MAG: ABC transporter ATP-binding protein [Planctomycetota bacterium]